MNTAVRVRLAKWYGKEAGYRGDKGGWIRFGQMKVAQGWLAFYYKYRTAIWKAMDEGTYQRHDIEKILEIGKASLRRKIERDFSDRQDAKPAVELLKRRGKQYRLDEIEYIAGFMISGHDDCVEAHPEDYSRVEVFRVRQNQERYERVLKRLEGALGRKPVFDQLPAAVKATLPSGTSAPQ